jgi:endonuclease III
MNISAPREKIDQLICSQRILRQKQKQSSAYRRCRLNRLPGMARKAAAYFIAHPELCRRAA